MERGLWAAAVAIGLAGCAEPVAAGLDDARAGRVVVALETAGIAAREEPDPAAEGKVRVTVERDDAPRALAVLRDEELPERASPGVLDALGKGGIVPSALAERAQWIAGLSGDLEKTLASIDGVLSARVHLAPPLADPLAEGPRPRATASVLVKHRGATPPVAAAEVKRLVAGAMSGLADDNVAVVFVSRPVPASAPDRQLARLGPIAATQGSVRWLRLGVALAAATNLALLAFGLALWSKLKRARAAAPPA